MSGTTFGGLTGVAPITRKGDSYICFLFFNLNGYVLSCTLQIIALNYLINRAIIRQGKYKISGLFYES